MGLENKLKEMVDSFEHIYNPSHIYCRLRELGFTKLQSRDYVNLYENSFYKEINSQILRKYEKNKNNTERFK